MTRPAPWLSLALALAVAGCGSGGGASEAPREAVVDLPPDRRDAEALGHELFDLIDRAVDYRGSHRGRPAASLRQMGVDSLTPATARHLLNVSREPVVTVKFRKPEGRQITSCRGDSQILEEAALNGGRFTLMCTTRTGAQRPILIGPDR